MKSKAILILEIIMILFQKMKAQTTYNEENITWINLEVENKPEKLTLDTKNLDFVTKKAGKNCRRNIVFKFSLISLIF